MRFSHHMLVHFLLATIASYLAYFLFRDPEATFLCFISSTLPDLDHIIDFWFANGINLNPITFWKQTLQDRKNYFDKTGKVCLLFHGWEYILIALVAGILLNRFRLAISFLLGYGVHLLWDQINFGKYLLSYSLLFRAARKFDLKKLIGHNL